MDEPVRYRLEPTRACLQEKQFAIRTRGLDFVASTALAGAFRAAFDTNEVTVVFGNTATDAERTERAYRNFAPRRLNLGDLLVRRKNVVLVFAGKPSAEQLESITACLEG